MLTTNQRRALTLVANATYGCTVPYMRSHGCTVAVLRHLARSRLTITDRVREAGKPGTLTVVRLRISNAGRKALAQSAAGAGREAVSPLRRHLGLHATARPASGAIR
jgi:hypothetical protein